MAASCLARKPINVMAMRFSACHGARVQGVSTHPFLFSQARNFAVFACRRVVREGAPVLYVSHADNGEWQFLCGGEHGEAAPDDPGLLVCLDEIIARDPSLNALATMCGHHDAVRPAPAAPWNIRDRTEEDVLRAVEEHGFWVALIDDAHGSFAYTVGLSRRYRHPEIIVYGLPPDAMQAILEACGEAVRAGARFTPGTRTSSILANHDVEFRAVQQPKNVHQAGYACWFHGGDWFPLLQCVWPDKHGRFPSDPKAPAWLKKAQPLPA